MGGGRGTGRELRLGWSWGLTAWLGLAWRKSIFRLENKCKLVFAHRAFFLSRVVFKSSKRYLKVTTFAIIQDDTERHSTSV